MTTRFRPTPYRDMHLGHALCAWENWQTARRSGGEFVLIIDDLDYRLQNLRMQSWSLTTAAARWQEDLTWLGMAPDRVEWSARGREDRHAWAAERVGVRPLLVPDWYVSVLAEQTAAGTSAGMVDAAGPDVEGWIEAEAQHPVAPYLMACSAVDDHDFGVDLFWCGRDLLHICGLYWWYFRCLGYIAPAMYWHKLVKCQAGATKLSKRDVKTVSIAQLRDRGYRPGRLYDGHAVEPGIMDTLRECRRRSREAGSEAIIIPEGVLGADERVCLPYRNTEALRCAQPGGDFAGQPWEQDVREAARRVLHAVVAA